MAFFELDIGVEELIVAVKVGDVFTEPNFEIIYLLLVHIVLPLELNRKRYFIIFE